MFRDNSLIPSEAIRLAALGFLAEGPRRYGELAAAIRHFTACVAGPSLELMGTSLELLRLEGLVAETAAEGGLENAVLALTPAGAAALQALLQARLRAPLGDFNRLALLLKLRFLEVLPVPERAAQVALITESVESELLRLRELRRGAGNAPHLLDWLDHDIAGLEARLRSLGGAAAAAAQ